MKHHRGRIALPSVLIALGVWLLHGCIYIPTFNKVEDGENVTKKIGDSSSRKPIRINRSNRADVERVLGPPKYVSGDGLRIAYGWRVLEGIWVMPLCFTIDDQRGFRGAVLTFDEAGTLRSMQDVKDGEYIMHQARLESALPRDLLPQAVMPPPPPQTSNPAPPPSGPRYDTPPSP